MTNNPVWPFSKNTNDGGYINNPSWTDDPADTHRHHPCGYWPGATPSQAQKVAYGQLFGAGANLSYQLGLGTSTQYQTSFLQTGSSSFFTKAITTSNNNLCSFALRNDYTLWCVGSNTYGQLGLGDNVNRTVWTQVTGEWMDFSMSPYYPFTIAIKTDGTLWSTGLNDYGQLGLGDTVNRNVFTQVGSSTEWRKIYCGSLYSIAINSSDNIFAAGNSYEGATGLGYGAGNETSFTYIDTMAGVDIVSCGYYSTAALLTDGSLWVTGSNTDGQLGLGNTTPKTVFTRVDDAGIGIQDISMGWNGTAAYHGVLFIIKSDRTLWAAGSNLYNIMGIADDDLSDKTSFVQLTGTDWDKISSKDNSVLGIKTDGTLWGCGRNAYGELGLGDRVARTAWEQIGSDLWLTIYTDRSSFGIKWDGTYIWV